MYNRTITAPTVSISPLKKFHSTLKRSKTLEASRPSKLTFSTIHHLDKTSINNKSKNIQADEVNNQRLKALTFEHLHPIGIALMAELLKDNDFLQDISIKSSLFKSFACSAMS